MKSLSNKLVNVAKAVGGLKKDGFNSHHKFKFVTHDAVVDAVRNALAQNGVNFTPSILNVAKEGKSYLVNVAYTLTDSETGESETVNWFGEGMDSQDKGLYKALTQAKKTFLLNKFLIPTGEQYADGDYGQGYDEEKPRESKPSKPSGPPPGMQPFTSLPKDRQDKARAKLFAMAGELGVDAYDAAGHLLANDPNKGRPSLGASTVNQVGAAVKHLQKLVDALPQRVSEATRQAATVGGAIDPTKLDPQETVGGAI